MTRRVLLLTPQLALLGTQERPAPQAPTATYRLAASTSGLSPLFCVCGSSSTSSQSGQRPHFRCPWCYRRLSPLRSCSRHQACVRSRVRSRLLLPLVKASSCSMRGPQESLLERLPEEGGGEESTLQETSEASSQEVDVGGGKLA